MQIKVKDPVNAVLSTGRRFRTRRPGVTVDLDRLGITDAEQDEIAELDGVSKVAEKKAVVEKKAAVKKKADDTNGK